MRWFAHYHSNLLKKIYEGSPWGGSDKLDGLWPVFVGGLIFAGFDLSLKLHDPGRLILLGLLMVPGLIWLAHIYMHEFKAFRLWLKRRKSVSERAD